MKYSLGEIAKALGATVHGDETLVVTGVNEPAACGPDQLAMAIKPEFAETLADGQAQAAMMWDGADWRAFGLKAAIVAPRPRFAMAGLSGMMDPGQGYGSGVHPSAVVDPSAKIGANVAIGPLAVIGPEAVIGDNSVIGPHCHVGWSVTLGAGTVLHSGVKIGARVTIGDRFIAQPGAAIGGDGFSFVTPEPSGVEKARESLGAEGATDAQQWARIHSLGGVTIGNDVEIGANSCIDRGTVRDTFIGNGVKFDNLVQIGHNVVIEDDCLICAQTGVAGSSKIGRGTVLGGQTGISDNLNIGENVITGGGTVVLSNIPAGRVMLGYPAMKMETHIEVYKGLRRLPRLFRDVSLLRKSVSNGESNT